MQTNNSLGSESRLNVKKFFNLFCTIFPGNGGRIGLLFYVSCWFQLDIIQILKQAPNLFIYGPPAAGKTLMATILKDMFEGSYTPAVVFTEGNSTYVEKIAKLGMGITWYDEYVGSVDHQRVQELKKAYDYLNTTDLGDHRPGQHPGFIPFASHVVTMQEAPINNAELHKRCVMLGLGYPRRINTLEQIAANETMWEARENKSLALIGPYICQFRELMRSQLETCYANELIVIMYHFAENPINEEIAKNMAVLTATYQILKGVIDFPFDDQQMYETAYSVAQNHNTLIR